MSEHSQTQISAVKKDKEEGSEGERGKERRKEDICSVNSGLKQIGTVENQMPSLNQT